MRKFREEKDGELWNAVALWLANIEVTLPAAKPTWVHKDHSAGNPTFHCESGLSIHVLGFKRKLDDGWTITSVLLKEEVDD